jgi:hypothetical protein
MTGPNVTKTKSRKPSPKVTPAQLRRRLEQKLLAVGGSAVLWQGSDLDASLIAACGRPYNQRVRMRRGEPHQCHANAADLWATGTNRYVLVTGYALTVQRWSSVGS